MFEATFINLGIGIGSACLSIGGAYALLKSGVNENSRRIGTVEDDLKENKERIYAELTDQGKGVAAVNAKVDILLKEKGLL